MQEDVRFGDYRFDVATGRLWSGAQEIRLTPKAAAVLKELVARAGQPVTKEELFGTVWRETIVSDDALTSCIQELRRALADDAKQPRFIETRHRRGYRFVAPVGKQSLDAATPSAACSGEISSIAVLPFADMSPGRDQDYLCEGLAEELINALTQIDGLPCGLADRVISIPCSRCGRPRARSQLAVGTLLEGSVRKADSRLRVTVQLIEVATGYHRWSRRFDRMLDDVFAIQDEIAESVVASLRGSVLSQQEKQALVRPHTDAAAYEYYLRGLQTLPRMTQLDLEASGEMFGGTVPACGRCSPG